MYWVRNANDGIRGDGNGEKLIEWLRGVIKFHEEQKEKWILGGKVGERPSIIESYVDVLIANDVVPVVRCKDCKYRGDYACPMYHEEYIEWDDDGYHETDIVEHDRTTDDGYCDLGERRTDE